VYIHDAAQLEEALDDLRSPATRCSLLILAPLRVTRDVSIPATAELWFGRNGAIVAAANNVLIEIGSPIRAPEEQEIFRTEASISCHPSLHPREYLESTSCFRVYWTGQLVANWWGGRDIAERWNHMRASLDLRTNGRSSRSFKIVGEHDFATSFNMTGFRNPDEGFVIDFGSAMLTARGITAYRLPPEAELPSFSAELADRLRRDASRPLISRDFFERLEIAFTDAGVPEPLRCSMRMEAIQTAERISIPALDLTHSRGLRLYNLRLRGEPEPISCRDTAGTTHSLTLTPDVGVLLARDQEGDASGEHIFYGSNVTGFWRFAALYNVMSETNHFIGGSFVNSHEPLVGREEANYVLFFGNDNTKNVTTLYETGISTYERGRRISATGQDLTDLRVKGVTTFGIYLRGFDDVHLNEVFLKSGTIQKGSSHIVLDSTVSKMTGISIRRLKTEGSRREDTTDGIPDHALVVIGREIGNLVYDHVSDGARLMPVVIIAGPSSDENVSFSDFRIYTARDTAFTCADPMTLPSVLRQVVGLEEEGEPLRAPNLKQVRIVVNGAREPASPRVDLRKCGSFWGEAYLPDPQTKLVLPEGNAFEALVYDTGETGARNPRLWLKENGSPTLLIDSLASVGPGTQAGIRLRNQAAREGVFDWQIYGRARRINDCDPPIEGHLGSLGIRNVRASACEIDVVTLTQQGYVGIGTEAPSSKLHVAGHYVQWPSIAGPPPAGDCTRTEHAGRMVVRTDGPLNVYVCTGTEWIGLQRSP
jgi:hypothetical protein